MTNNDYATHYTKEKGGNMFSPQYSGLKTLAENGYLRKLEDNEQIPIPTSLQLRCNSLLGYIHQPNRIICDDIEDDNQNGKEQLCLCVKNLWE